MIYQTTNNYQMQAIIKEIVWHKKLEVAQIQQDMSWASLQRQLTAAPTVRDFLTALQLSIYKPSLIAEVKKASLYHSVIRPDFDPVTIAQAYKRGGASCVSVVTDQKFFHGGFDHLRAIRYRVGIPLLCRDFIIDPCQIYLARSAGADAILLIAAILTDKQLQNFLRVIHYLGMNAVIQIDNLNDLDRILALEDVRVIVINNQSLSDFSININITQELLTARRSLIQKLGIVVISESGIETPDDLALLAGVGVQTVIMGESLLKENDLEVAVRNLLQAKFPINYQRNYT
ncbi:indole-3-glycerol phosphate synthase TrpC [Aphanizomenon flos-aquae NRERC-008]|jgi:indole-3-glycerol phosphate synthase|uniref:Indole-3-glycerol phosphate synthase n=2 Tax=Aphanizomenon flos-aquae TaxID=1176 RepID=A0A1B7X6P0_APHFL|nr:MULTISPECIES: indole-3-glycerol phosphate synthase TrpC [Aphanizomenon]MCE2905444.1 indole-3-glycerol phosphate synthase TrpC [Anabaena sp. CoA2_C59]MDJ0506015.1 indole-3-glycerol phosphate synthase TrpC [Nostocales cyanobacterium LE14-WE12]NTW19498.1 indole-3-glycerol-phosphate synthase [Nostocales cyanobacterium W4_Combined_metabat2_030]OBQ30293.1 MAG: indole-3-glycerol phosphate synthase [Aphanizomenon flos-aquae MDT14a]OBQ45033.1 MAG: indole-3-glycerol phosphate synthase [Aphanizomenon 